MSSTSNHLYSDAVDSLYPISIFFSPEPTAGSICLAVISKLYPSTTTSGFVLVGGVVSNIIDVF